MWAGSGSPCRYKEGAAAPKQKDSYNQSPETYFAELKTARGGEGSPGRLGELKPLSRRPMGFFDMSSVHSKLQAMLDD
jgi:hypothetical protein